MLPAVVVATLVFFMPPGGYAQGPSVLHIKVGLVDAERNTTPVPRHALLISSNPSSAAPRLVVTRADGTADVELRPGNYTVESDHAVTFHGNAYQWTQVVEIAAGHDTVLDLTADNAEVEAVSGSDATSKPAMESDGSLLIPQWKNSVLALWTPTSRASGFVIDARGLILTNGRAVGAATSVEVQLTPAIKVAGTVLAANAERDVAVLWIDPEAMGSLRPVPLACKDTARPPVTEGQELFVLGVPVRHQDAMTSATVRRVSTHAIVSDLVLTRGSAGGPVFAAAGELVGLTSVTDDPDQRESGDARIVRREEACEVVASAMQKMKTAPRPVTANLPMEPSQAFPAEALKQAATGRAGSLSPYKMSSSSFDIAFITPVLTYGARMQAELVSRRGTARSGRAGAPEPTLIRPLLDFSNWSWYVDEYPPVLLVRVTPRMVESFWTTVARGAARTQGVALPPIKHFKSGFGRLRALCGDAEVLPIHPFKLEQRVSETDAIYEGLYAFDPGALGPQCGSVKLVLYSDKDPDKGDTRVVEPSVVEQIWQDFAGYRSLPH